MHISIIYIYSYKKSYTLNNDRVQSSVWNQWTVINSLIIIENWQQRRGGGLRKYKHQLDRDAPRAAVCLFCRGDIYTPACDVHISRWARDRRLSAGTRCSLSLCYARSFNVAQLAYFQLDLVIYTSSNARIVFQHWTLPYKLFDLSKPFLIHV